MAKWSDKEIQKRKAEQRAQMIARRTKAINLLEKNGWKVKTFSGVPFNGAQVEHTFPVEQAYWEVKMPGASSMIVRKVENLERFGIGMS